MKSLEDIVAAIGTPALLKAFTQELWVCECHIGSDGVAVFHVERLEEASSPT